MGINGQTQTEYQKNFTRIDEIIRKSNGDKDKQIRLAKSQANLITNQYKAINRAKAAKEKGHDHLFEVFFRRAYEIGGVSTQEYREYVLEKLFEDTIEEE